eukprot:1767618-Lingulodinium_polyedra.AAC.1
MAIPPPALLSCPASLDTAVSEERGSPVRTARCRRPHSTPASHALHAVAGGTRARPATRSVVAAAAAAAALRIHASLAQPA